MLTGVETEGKPNVILHMVSDDTKPEVTHDIYGIDYNTGIEDVMGVESKNVELDYMVNLCAYMKKRNKIAQAENIMKRILDKFAKNRNEVEKMVEAKRKGAVSMQYINKESDREAGNKITEAYLYEIWIEDEQRYPVDYK